MTYDAQAADKHERRQALWILAAITLIGAIFRFYNIGWATPFKHFQIDEYSVTGPADEMYSKQMSAAVDFAKFFMYGPVLMYFINAVRFVYETVAQPLKLDVVADQVTYMVMARAISATLGTLTILVVYAIATRIAGRRAGLISAALLACSVLHLRDSHFATTDITVTFFCAVGLWCAMRVAERDTWPWLVAAGVVTAFAMSSKFTGGFVLGVVGLAYLLGPSRPRTFAPIGPWVPWVARGLTPIIAAAAAYYVLNPLVFQFWQRFVDDLRIWVYEPLSGLTKFAWTAQFTDIGSPRVYWFTNLLWWSYGPMLEIAGLAGIVWLVMRRQTAAALAAAYALLYFLVAGGTTTPFIRYMLPLAPVLAVGAGVLCRDLIASARWRGAGLVLTAATVAATALYAGAYMNVFSRPDSRLEAAQWIDSHIPEGAKVMLEPAQNAPPTGEYLHHPVFHQDYLVRCEFDDIGRYHLFSMDVYQRLFDQRLCDGDRHLEPDSAPYVREKLAKAEWIVIDDTNIQNYQHLPSPQYDVVKQYYRDLLGEKLGFKLIKTFKVYPKIFGREINDDGAELTFRLFDHPRVYIFKRST